MKLLANSCYSSFGHYAWGILYAHFFSHSMTQKESDFENLPPTIQPGAAALGDAWQKIPLVLENYERVEKLGRGGFGVVFRVRHTGLHWERPMKVLDPDCARTKEGTVFRTRLSLSANFGLCLAMLLLLSSSWTAAGVREIPGLVTSFEEKLPEIGNLLGTLESPRSPEPWPDIPIPVFQARESDEPFEAGGVSKNGEWLAFISDDIQVWHAASRMVAYAVSLPAAHEGFLGNGSGRLEPKGCVVSNDGRHVVVFAGIPPPIAALSSESGTVKGDGRCFLIDLKSGDLIHSWESSESSAQPAFSWNGAWLTGGDRESCFVVNLSGGHEVKREKAVDNNELWVASDGRWWAIPRGQIPDWFHSHLSSVDGSVSADPGGEVTDRVAGGKWWAGWENQELGVDPKSDNLDWAGDGRLRIRDDQADVLLDPLTLTTERGPGGHLWWAGPTGTLWCGCDPPEFDGGSILWKSKEGNVSEVFNCVGSMEINDLRVREDGRIVWVGTREDEGGKAKFGWQVLKVPDGKRVTSGPRALNSSSHVDFSSDGAGISIDRSLYDLSTGRLIASMQGDRLGITAGGEILRAVPSGVDRQRNWRVVAYDFLGHERWKSEQLVSIGYELGWGCASVSPDSRFAWLPPLYGYENAEHILDLRTGKTVRIPDSGHGLLPSWTARSIRLVAQDRARGAVVWEAPWVAANPIAESTILPIRRKSWEHDMKPQGFIKIDRDGSGAVLLDGELGELRRLNGWRGLDSVRELRISPNGRWLLVQASYSGEHAIWDLKNGHKVADVFAVGGGNWVIVLPNGAYACSPGAADAVALRWRGRPCALDRFDLEFNRPDLVIMAFEGDEKRATRFESMVNFRQRAGRKDDDTKAVSGSPAADLKEIPDIRVLELNRRGQKASIQLAITGVWESDSLRIVHNGARIFPSVSKKGDRCEVAGIRLASGRNILGFEVHSASGRMSPRSIIECDAGDVSVKPVVRALCVGIGDYPGVEADLPGATNDAKALAEAMRLWDGEDQKVDAFLLLDSQASPEAIVRKTRELADASNPDDLLFVFIAGHGVNRMGSGYQVVGPSFQTGGELRDTLPLETMVNTMARAGALRRVLILDTCETGNAGSPEFGYDVDDLFPTPGIAAGVAVFGASRWNQFAFESEKTGHGFFSGALLDALRIDPFRPRVGNGSVKLSHLAAFVRARVEKASDGNQSPVMIARSWRGNIDLLKSNQLESYYRMLDTTISGMSVKTSITNDLNKNRDLPSAPYLRVIRNSIFARHGSPFESDDLKAFFESFDFYRPDSAFQESRLSEEDREDVAWLAQFEGKPNPGFGMKGPRDSGVWIFPDSSIRELSVEELGKLNADGLWRARNEIYARHGFVFQSDRGKRFTESLGAVYRPVSKDLNEIQRSLNDVERRNIERIQQKEGGR